MNISEIAKKYEVLGLTKEEVENKYKAFLERYQDGVKALRALLISLKKLEFSLKETKLVSGFFVGVEELVDLMELRKRRALRMYESELREEAINAGLVSPDGIPLWRDKPITQSVYSKIAWACINEELDGAWWLAKVRAQGDQAFNFNPSLFKPVEFRVRPTNDELRITAYTTFKEIEKPWVIADVLESGKALPCFKVSEVLSLEPTELVRRGRIPIAMLGWAITIKRAGEVKYIDITDEDADTYIRCFLRYDHPLNFGENSKVYAIGYPSKGREGRGYVFRTYGLYPDPEERTPAE